MQESARQSGTRSFAGWYSLAIALAAIVTAGSFLIPRSTFSQVAVLRGHTEAAYRVEFSPDGRLLASGGFDGTARLWDVAERRELYSLPHDSAVTCIAFHPRGEWLATGAGTKVTLWNVADGSPVRKIEFEVNAMGLAFSADGARLLVGGGAIDFATGAERGELSLWNPDTGERLAPSILLAKPVRCVALSADGKTAAYSGECKEVRLRSLDPPGDDAVLDPVQAEALRFTADGQSLLIAFHHRLDGLGLWDLSNKEYRVKTTLVAPETSFGAALSPDGQHMAQAIRVVNRLTNVGFGSARVYRTSDGEQIGTIPDGDFFARGGGKVVYDVAFPPDGKHIATCNTRGEVKLWDLDQIANP